MNISALSLKRPVSTIMFFMAFVILGFISWSRLPQELFPSINYPQITVVTKYENAAPEEIESLVSRIVEEAVGTVNNVKRINSTSKEGVSLVIIDLKWGTNMDFAALNVREKIDLIKEKLPRDSDDPLVMKYNPFELPVMNLAITAKNMSSVDLRETTRKYIKEAIQKIEGVANASITGGDIKEILVEIDQARLRASKTSIVSIVDGLEKANLNYPAGTVKERSYEYLIRTIGEFQSIAEIEDAPVAVELSEDDDSYYVGEGLRPSRKQNIPKRLVYLKDIANVRESVKERTSISRYNGRESISLVIRKQSGSNTLKVSEAIRKEINALLETKLPAGINIEITYDQATFIKESISSLRSAALGGAVLAIIVLLFFLRDVIASLAIALSIPISLMASLCFMYFFKINLNLMSLGGLALGIGMLVDNSIVVIENITRHRQSKDLAEACRDGAAEMALPIFGSTLTTVAVFLPFAFVVGIAGQLFKQLSFTITISLLISVVVALTLIPVVIYLGRAKGGSTFSHANNNQLFENIFKFKYIIFITTIILFLLSLKFLSVHEKIFLPSVDQRQFIIKLDMLPGTKLETTDLAVMRLEEIASSINVVDDITVNIGSNDESDSEQESLLKPLDSHQAQIMVRLKKEGISTQDVIDRIRGSVDRDDIFSSAELEYVAQDSSLGQVLEDSLPVVVEIRGPDFNRLAEMSAQIRDRLKKIDGLYSVKGSIVPPTPETKLNIRKDKASLYGLSVKDISLASKIALKGHAATQFKVKNEEDDIDITVRLDLRDRATLEDVKNLLIYSPTLGMMIPLSEVAYFLKGSGPTQIKRINQQKAVLVTASVSGRKLKDIYKDIDKSLKDFYNMRDYEIQLSGQKEKMKESFSSLAFALILALVLIYMIMASEFESLWQPFIIMFIVPLSLIGVSIVLFITKTPLSVVAYLGIIMLGGIVVNNGIVLIDFINGLRKQGYSAKDAAIQAAIVRLRPIFMTSLTTILGMLPLALGIGEGAELRSPLALTVIGGLITATILTPLIIPMIYVLIAQLSDN